MKSVLLALSLFCMGNALADCSKPHRAAFNLYEAQDKARDLVKCRTPRCIERKFNQLERSVCRAIHRCEDLGELVEVSCLPNHTLTPESRQKLESDLQRAGEKLVQLAVDGLRSLRDAVLGRDDDAGEEPLEESLEPEEEMVGYLSLHPPIFP